jgi:hypothetical protein
MANQRVELKAFKKLEAVHSGYVCFHKEITRSSISPLRKVEYKAFIIVGSKCYVSKGEQTDPTEAVDNVIAQYKEAQNATAAS